MIDGCFILDEEGALAVAQTATGGEADEVTISDQSFLTGPPGEEEVTSCSLRESGENGDDVPGIASVGAGTTLATADQHRERLLREENSSVIEGEAPGLAPEQVVAADHDDIRTFAWVNEDFVISIHAPVEVLEVDAGFAALPVAVEEVARTLAG